MPRCGIVKQLCTSLSLSVAVSLLFSFPFLSFFFAAVKIGFSLLVNAGGAAMSKALCKPPFPNAKSPEMAARKKEASNGEEEKSETERRNEGAGKLGQKRFPFFPETHHLPPRGELDLALLALLLPHLL